MKALLSVSSGQDVIVVSKSYGLSELKCAMARRVMGELGRLEAEKGTKRVIHFVNGKRVYFVTKEDLVDDASGPRLRGVDADALIIYDIEP